MMLRQSLSCGLSCTLLWYWMHFVLLGRLKEMAAIMAHLDPTEIIATPFPFEQLLWFVGIVATIQWFLLLAFQWSHAQGFFLYLKHSVQGTFLFYFVFVLCGADPWRHILQTMATAWYVTHLVVLIKPWSPPDKPQTNFQHVLKHLLHWDNTNLASFQIYGTLLVAIPFQVLHVLDWGIQIQRWPLPVIIGTTYGWIVGSALGIIWTQVKSHLGQ